MIVIAIILAVIIIISLLRFGLTFEYGDSGISVRIWAGAHFLRVYPQKEKSEKQEIKKLRKKEKKAKKKAEEAKTEKPGGLKGFLDKLPVILKGVGRLRRKLLVKKLTVRFVSGDEDPSKAALLFGASNAAYGLVIPILENTFRIKKRDISSSADFEAAQPSIYVNAAISIAVWEAVYVFFAILPIFTKSTAVRKDGKKNGKAPDK